MSNPHSVSPAAASNEDGVNLKKIVLVGAVSLAIFIISAVIAHLILKSEEAKYRAGGPPTVATEIGKPEIGIVDQPTFDGDNRLELWQAEKKRILGSYGWADRKKGLVHLPIEDAMKEVVRQAASGGAR
jgi:hypothetical protein